MRTLILGIDFSKNTWTIFDAYAYDKEVTTDSMYKWIIKESPEGECNNSMQSMQHLVPDSQLIRYDGRFDQYYLESSGLIV